MYYEIDISDADKSKIIFFDSIRLIFWVEKTQNVLYTGNPVIKMLHVSHRVVTYVKESSNELVGDKIKNVLIEYQTSTVKCFIFNSGTLFPSSISFYLKLQFQTKSISPLPLPAWLVLRHATGFVRLSKQTFWTIFFFLHSWPRVRYYWRINRWCDKSIFHYKKKKKKYRSRYVKMSFFFSCHIDLTYFLLLSELYKIC